jgi:hypothetical protein
MLEPLVEGDNRIVYQAGGLQDGLAVTVQFWTPSLERSSILQLEELGDGLYYIDYNFDNEGAWIGLFFEDGVKKGTQVYKVTLFVLGYVTYNGRR